MEIDRLEFSEKIHDDDLPDASQAEIAFSVIQQHPLPAVPMVLSLTFDPFGDPVGMNKKQQLRREQKEEDGRDIEGQDQKYVEYDPQNNGRDPGPGPEQQKRQEQFR